MYTYAMISWLELVAASDDDILVLENNSDVVFDKSDRASKLALGMGLPRVAVGNTFEIAKSVSLGLTF
ncbi:hypothetical protein O9G_005366 [Rozella allomycis CSF55]|uniref:Uncharacterized protein n=1 Tax=Rozella allomycis (strain CSF55) TaxID=988480 RepID=A0A075B306_ROZAC|nr:hypothetical protein O9G_005366 [Rozella allomycis CSF55]|eukprot:EPZ35163.1 hypothetical protein O9G_005366 [Rozella allomycis CSF55]